MDIFKPPLRLFWKMNTRADEKRIAAQTPDKGVTIALDVPYVSGGHCLHTLDIFYPDKQAEKLPVIINIHGGGWMSGDKKVNRNFCIKLAKEGFLVVAVNYRLVGEFEFKHQLEDVFSALEWAGKNLCDYPADLSRVFLSGDSAGGQLACVAAAICSDKKLQKEFNLYKPQFDFKAVGLISPAVEMVGKTFLLNINLPSLLGKNHRKSPHFKLMNFSSLASNSLPPFYIVTARKDFLRKQAYMLARILDEHKVEYKLLDFNDKVGGKNLPHVFSVVDPFTEPSKQVIEGMTGFFKRHI